MNTNHEWINKRQVCTMRDATPQYCKKCGKQRLRYWRRRKQKDDGICPGSLEEEKGNV
jgi:hypothetical protein